MNENDVMAFNPFEGDRDLDLRTLFDKMVTARKARPCCDCGQLIAPGTRIRSRSDVFDGAVKSLAWCSECCEAMALSWTDGGKALAARIARRPTETVSGGGAGEKP